MNEAPATSTPAAPQGEAPPAPAAPVQAPASAEAKPPAEGEGDKPAPTPREIEEQKLVALRLRNAERKARLESTSAKTKAEREAIEARAKALDEREGAVKRWAEDPKAALAATGLDARAALEALVREAELDGTPQGELLKFRKEIAVELEKIRTENAELKAERDARIKAEQERAEAAQLAEAEGRFLDVLRGPAYAALTAKLPNGEPVYSDAELRSYGHFYADQLLKERGRGKFTFQDVAARILQEHNKMAARFGHVSSNSPAADQAGKTVNGGRRAPNTLSNKGTASPGKPRLSFAEKVAAAKQKFA